ncbi:MAG: hypothetical protein LBO05_04225 [Deltaproteobacteria bacterium]|nr:hypothetical protein [Deltaproteobacteria bacterium]
MLDVGDDVALAFGEHGDAESFIGQPGVGGDEGGKGIGQRVERVGVRAAGQGAAAGFSQHGELARGAGHDDLRVLVIEMLFERHAAGARGLQGIDARSVGQHAAGVLAVGGGRVLRRVVLEDTAPAAEDGQCDARDDDGGFFHGV